MKVTKFFLRMIAAKTREESQIKFGMVKKRMGGGMAESVMRKTLSYYKLL